ncbi:MAG: hypothetical protein H6733_04785 [Alphaproteobacteria bacterium]|nr:hypothetical protein [Alphaproteobacteria bacterium]
MALTRSLLWLTLVGCVPPGRELVTTTVTFVAEAPRPPGGASAIALTEARISVADLTLLDRDGLVGGAWPGLRRLDLLADPTPMGIVDVYTGAYAASRFVVGGVPTLHLVGTTTLLDGTDVPFDLELTGSLPVANAATEVVVGLEGITAPLVWSLSLTRAINRIDWATPVDDDGVLTTADGEVGPALREGLTDPLAWSVGQGDVDTATP